MQGHRVCLTLCSCTGHSQVGQDTDAFTCPWPFSSTGAQGQEVQLFAATVNKVLDVLCCPRPRPGMLPGQVSQCMCPSEHISLPQWLGHTDVPQAQGSSIPVFLCCSRPCSPAQPAASEALLVPLIKNKIAGGGRERRQRKSEVLRKHFLHSYVVY